MCRKKRWEGKAKGKKCYEKETYVLEAPGAEVPEGLIMLGPGDGSATTDVRVTVPPPSVGLNGVSATTDIIVTVPPLVVELDDVVLSDVEVELVDKLWMQIHQKSVQNLNK